MKLKFIADANVEKPIIDYLLKNNYDVKWIPDYDCKITDDNLLKRARAEKRILITNDKDFGELIFLQKKSSRGIILFRCKGDNSKEKIKILEKVLNEYRDKILKRFIVITRKRIRIIPLEELK